MLRYGSLKIAGRRSVGSLAIVSGVLLFIILGIYSIIASHNSVSADSINTTDFVTTWKTDNPGSSNSTSVYLSFVDGSNYEVDWDNDGVYDEIVASGPASHDYGTPGTYTIRVKGNFGQLQFGLWREYMGDIGYDPLKLLEVNQWGVAPWTSMQRAFYGAENVRFTATDAPSLGGVTTMEEAFHGADNLNQPIGHWDVSNVTNMKSVFQFTDFNQPLDEWDVSNVTNMSYMFSSANRFNQPIGSWNVSNVTDMSHMFDGAGRFNQPIEDWDVSSVETMEYMFGYATVFNQSLNDWDVSSVTNMNAMFQSATVFNQPLDEWDVSSVAIMQGMFSETESFNQPIGGWDMSNVTNTGSMFSEAVAFNQPIGGWDMSNVVNIRYMFYRTESFNQPLNSWDISSVQDISAVFAWSKSFNQPIGGWDISNVLPDQVGMLFYGSVISPDNYDATLLGWLEIPELPRDVVFTGHYTQYCNPAPRQELIDDFGWTFYGDKPGCGMIKLNDLYYNSHVFLQYDDIVDTGIVGGIEVEGFTPALASLTCTLVDPIEFDESASEMFEFSGNTLVLSSPDPSGDNFYDVCIRAEDGNGNFSESVHRIIVQVTPLSLARQIDTIEFGESGEHKLLAVSGNNFLDSEEGFMEALFRSMVSLNGVGLPFCAAGFGMTAPMIVEEFELEDASVVSDEVPCYELVDMSDGSNPYRLTTTQTRIILPADFDTEAPGTVSVNGSPEFAFNQPDGGDDGDDEDEGDGGTIPGGGDDEGGDGDSDGSGGSDPTISPTIVVNGSGPITASPTIPTRPSFSGVANPGATVVVTVHSDPISCSATAGSDGSWSCILPSNLPAGQHTVYALITNPDNSTIELGPYIVYVQGSNPTAIDNNTPLAPNSGVGLVEKIRAYKEGQRKQTAYLAIGIMTALVGVVGFGLSLLRHRRRSGAVKITQR